MADSGRHRLLYQILRNQIKLQQTMWNTDTLWFETAIVSMVFPLGHIAFGHFEERSPRSRKLLKYIVTMAIILGISVFAGRVYALSLFAVSFVPVFYIHFILLPKKGINGWTGEPKDRYYDFRGWDKNIFRNDRSGAK
jgi:hypothetical protein